MYASPKHYLVERSGYVNFFGVLEAGDRDLANDRQQILLLRYLSQFS